MLQRKFFLFFVYNKLNSYIILKKINTKIFVIGELFVGAVCCGDFVLLGEFLGVFEASGGDCSHLVLVFGQHGHCRHKVIADASGGHDSPLGCHPYKTHVKSFIKINRNILKYF